MSLVGNQVFANETTACWVGTDGQGNAEVPGTFTTDRLVARRLVYLPSSPGGDNFAGRTIISSILGYALVNFAGVTINTTIIVSGVATPTSPTPAGIPYVDQADVVPGVSFKIRVRDAAGVPLPAPLASDVPVNYVVFSAPGE